MHKQCECFLLHLRSIQSSCLRSSASAHAFFLPHTLHRAAGVASSARDGLRLGARSTCARPRLQTPPGDVRWPRASRAMRKGATWRTGTSIRLTPTRSSKGSCTLNLKDEDVLYSLQQRLLNGPLNLENAARSSIRRVSLNGSLSI
jgi:hypothetical protein